MRKPKIVFTPGALQDLDDMGLSNDAQQEFIDTVSDLFKNMDLDDKTTWPKHKIVDVSDLDENEDKDIKLH